MSGGRADTGVLHCGGIPLSPSPFALNTPPAHSAGLTLGELSEAQSMYEVSLLHVWPRRGADRPEATLPRASEHASSTEKVVES